MGKLTFRRVVSPLLRSKLNASLPVVGGVTFLVGSILFWPDITLAGVISAADWGAGLFVAGSVLYIIAPVVDFLDMNYSLQDMMEAAPTSKQAVGEATTLLPNYERLYKAQIVRTQRANSMLYAISAVCFVAGSFFFFPAQKVDSTHGAWFFIMGCTISFLGALLAAFAARESKKTREPYHFPPSAGTVALWWWGDEDAQVVSCSLYMLGDLIFAVASVCFFPKILFAGNLLVEGQYLAERAAIVLLVVGSVVFIAGATIDLLVLLRAPSRVAGLPPALGPGLEGGTGRARGDR